MEERSRGRAYEKLEGSVDSITFKSEDTGFTVLELNTGEELVTVVGSMVDVEVGEELSLTGFFTAHPSYGPQFRVQLYERKFPATAGAILKYLSGGAIKGIGPILARRIVEAFGDDALEVMEKQPGRLTDVKGITPKKAEEITREFQRIYGVRSVMLFLSRFGLDPGTSFRVWKKWGVLAKEAIEENPYLLTGQDIGVSFQKADEIALRLEQPREGANRVKAGLMYVLLHNLNNGHTCLPRDKLLAAASNLLQVEEEAMEESLEALLEENSLVQDTLEGRPYLYLPALYEAETQVAGRLRMMADTDPGVRSSWDRELNRLEEENGIRYAAQQRKAIGQAMDSRVFILTGGPGTGKTTTLNAIIRLSEERGDKVLLAAPTGRASKRLTEVTGREAKTIHRLLEVDFSDEEPGQLKFKRNEKNPLNCDLVIIDEMSMVDILLFESLIRALRLSTRLVLVGDSDQLPSVSAGNVLKDLIDSDYIPTVKLTEVFRQAAQSLIVTNAHAIVAGEYPDLSARDNDFFFMRRDNPVQAASTVLELVKTRLPQRYGFSPTGDIQVLCPARMGRAGTGELNRLLQQQLNPPAEDKREFTFNGVTFREGDKVMQVRNNYDITWRRDAGEDGIEYGSGIFNGDIGCIQTVDRAANRVMIRFDDRSADYTLDMGSELELAYAVTVHKSQGSEYEAVVLVLAERNPKLYYRNLLYTAVTRAKKLLVIVGRQDNVAFMVDNNRKIRRYSNLGRLLAEQAGMSELEETARQQELAD